MTPAMMAVYRRTALTLNRPDYPFVAVLLGTSGSSVIPLFDATDARIWWDTHKYPDTTYAALFDNQWHAPKLVNEYPVRIENERGTYGSR